MNRKLVLEQEACSTGDKITVTDFGDGFIIEVDEPWAGDTECGFGRTASITLTKEQAAQMVGFIDQT